MTANAGYGKGLNMTETEKKNLAMVRLWQELFNDADRMADECYAEDTEARCMGVPIVIKGREGMREGARAAIDASPRRRMRIDHVFPSGDVVVVEAALVDPDRGQDWETPFCAVLTFRDGLIVNDRSYLDLRRWPGISDVLADQA